jgi:hypothetical protein
MRKSLGYFPSLWFLDVETVGASKIEVKACGV